MEKFPQPNIPKKPKIEKLKEDLSGYIEHSKLTPEEMRIVIQELPLETQSAKKTVVAEWVPPKRQGENSPGASYLAILKIGEGKDEQYATIEVLLSGSLHISRNIKKPGIIDVPHNDTARKSTVRLFDSFKELINPLELTDAIRLRLGRKLLPIIMKRFDISEKMAKKILRLGDPHVMPAPHDEVMGISSPASDPTPYEE